MSELFELTLIYERTKCELGSEKIRTRTEKIENTGPTFSEHPIEI